MKNKGGHTSSTILNSCSFQRYRMSFRYLYSILLRQTLYNDTMLPRFKIKKGGARIEPEKIRRERTSLNSLNIG